MVHHSVIQAVYEILRQTILVDKILKMTFPDLYNKKGLSKQQDLM